MTTVPTPRIQYGPVTVLPELLRAAGRRRVFLILGRSGRYEAQLSSALAGFEHWPFREARRHVPRELVERAGRELVAFRADAVLSVGGGSATGLGKALRLQHSFHFVAVPTTYAGSELTTLYGVTSAAGKQTGRDPRVLPDLVLYDVELTLGMPLRLSVTSLINALAHPLSALSTAQLEPEAFEAALQAAGSAYAVVCALLVDAQSRAHRAAAFEATQAAARTLAGPVGLHHRMAHLLGGHFDLDHSSLHSVLLPHSLDHLRERLPQIHSAVCARLAEPDPAGRLLEFLGRAGAATSLADLGVPPAALRELIDGHPELPRGALEAALHGRRASAVPA